MLFAFFVQQNICHIMPVADPCPPYISTNHRIDAHEVFSTSAGTLVSRMIKSFDGAEDAVLLEIDSQSSGRLS